MAILDTKRISDTVPGTEQYAQAPSGAQKPAKAKPHVPKDKYVPPAKTADTKAAEPAIDGIWRGPLGPMILSRQGAELRGILTQRSAACQLEAGEQVFSGTVMEDNVTGEATLCLTGDAKRCAGTEKAFVLLLVAPDGKKMTGATHIAAKGCKAAGVLKNGGVEFMRTMPGTTTVPAGPTPIGNSTGYNPSGVKKGRTKWEVIAMDGARYLEQGMFERARERFLAAIEVDATRPEAYNGVGVTYRARNLFKDAMAWYRRAIDVNPDFGDAYYNIGCLYALEGKKDLALQYLKISVLNGYRDLGTLREDPDLASLKGDKAFEKLADYGLGIEKD